MKRDCCWGCVVVVVLSQLSRQKSNPWFVFPDPEWGFYSLIISPRLLHGPASVREASTLFIRIKEPGEGVRCRKKDILTIAALTSINT